MLRQTDYFSVHIYHEIIIKTYIFMTKNLRLLLLALLCTVFTGAWAGESTITTATFDGKNATYTEGWTTTGTGTNRSDCIIIGAGENITSPAFDFSGYTKVKISFKARRYGSLSGSKATIDASIGGTSMGTVDATNTSVAELEDCIEFTPTSSMTAAVLVFTCTNATSAGSTHGAGIGTITIIGVSGTEIAAPVFSPVAGIVESGTTITCSSATEGATVYYTTDGSTPTNQSTVFPTVGVPITEATTFKAIAIDAQDNASAVTTAAYTIKQEAAELTTVSNKTWVFGSTQAAYKPSLTANTIIDNMEICSGAEISSSNSGYLEIDGTNATTRINIKQTYWLHIKVAANSRITLYAKSSGSAVRNFSITTDQEGTTSVGTLTVPGGGNYAAHTFDYEGTTDTDLYFTNTSNGGCYVVGMKVVPMPNLIDPELAFSTTSFSIESGDEFTPPTLSYVEGFDGTVVYSSSDTDIATVNSETGAITFGDEVGTVTITASSDETETYKKDEASYTITVTKVYRNIAEFITIGNKKSGKMYFTDVQVLYKNGKDMYVRDDTGAIDFYDTTDFNANYTAGQVLNGSATLTYGVYNLMPEITAVADADLTATAGTATPTDITPAATLSDHICDLVKLNGTLVVDGSKYYISDGTNQVEIYNGKWENVDLTQFENGDEVTATGIVITYKSNSVVSYEISLISLESKISVDITSVGYSTLYYGTKYLTVPAGVTAKSFCLNAAGDDVEVLQTFEEGDVIPAGFGVVLEAVTKSDATQTFEFTVNGSNECIFADGNLLLGSDEAATTVGPDQTVEYYFYMLSTNSKGDEVGFYWGKPNGAAFTCGAHKAYMAIPKSSSVNASSFVFDNLNGIHGIQSDVTIEDGNVYTLSGMRVEGSQLPKGIYIVNGKKMVIK